MAWGGWRRYTLVAAVIAVVLATFAVLYGWLPWWIDGARLRGLSRQDQLAALSSDRGDVLKMVAGAGAVVALVYTARKHALDRKAHELTEQGQVTDRYTKAITQLASERESERIGGIYALERIMADSSRDHPTVVAVLAAFVRQHAPVIGRGTLPARQSGLEARMERMRARVTIAAVSSGPAADVQAAMTVLARRSRRRDRVATDLRRTALSGLELPPYAWLIAADFSDSNLAGATLVRAMVAGANLRGANLNGTNLGGADLSGSMLNDASMMGARLDGATLIDARLPRANLSFADLDRATLTGANLRQATLEIATLDHADLSRTSLLGATLSGTNLNGAILTGAQSLKPSQLADAIITGATVLDEALANDPWVQARIKDCEDVFPGEIPAPTPNPAPPQTSSD